MMLCGNNPLPSSTIPSLTKSPSQQSRAQRQAAARTAAAKSKSKLWGPSHSFDSDDEDSVGGKLGAAPRQAPTGSWWESMNKAWAEWGATAVEVSSPDPTAKRRRSQLGRKMSVVPEEEEEAGSSTDPSTQDDSNENRPSLNLSSGPNDSRSGAAHHPALNSSHDATTTIRNEANTSRDSSTKGNNNTSRDTSTKANNHNTSRDSGINLEAATSKVEAKVEEWTDLFSNACGAASPCSAHDLEELFGRQRSKTKQLNTTKDAKSKPAEETLGIAPMQLDMEEDDDIVAKEQPHQPPMRTLSEESPAERRRQRAAIRQKRHEQASVKAHEDFEVTSQQRVLITQPSTTSILQAQSQLPPPQDPMVPQPPPSPPTTPAPLEVLHVHEEAAQALERSISELTMRSSYQEIKHNAPSQAQPNPNEERRMAYYAVGRHHRLTSGPKSGGNRRCYFTGKLVFGGGAPFYAGIVQQGLRTLVVFCLPSALGMPHNLPNYSHQRRRASGSVSGSNGTGLLQRSRRTLSSAASASIALSKSPSKLSSTINLDDMSLSIEGDIDPNWNMPHDYLLSILPEPDEQVLSEMNQRYPEQFETLPVQVRHASCWRLFVKFCFFSGLPIAEGELHYQVRPKIALELYGEEIVLSHDVMEAVNGASSAEILTLPNLKTFRYLKRNYQQQSAKLPAIVFQRGSWEQVKAEV